MNKNPILRFAPSPNGELHLGHAYSALLNFDYARAHGGRLLLRIEDIDTARSRLHFEEQIYDDLSWLGIKWQQPVRRQSDHFEDYEKMLNRLNAMELLYPCFATRREIADAVSAGSETPKDPLGKPVYPGLHKWLGETEITKLTPNKRPPSLRLHMDRALELAFEKLNGPITYELFDNQFPNPQNKRKKTRIAHPARWGDVILKRKDTPASYHIAAVHDDDRQQVSHILRGRDLEEVTDIHRLLQVLLDLNQPLYHFHHLITDENQRKLSKSARDKSLKSLRAQGLTPRDIRRHLGLSGKLEKAR